MAPFEWGLLALATLLAGAAQGITGFGFAVLALPFYLSVLDAGAAVQLAIGLTLAVSCCLAPGLWRAAERGTLLRLSAGTLLGLPAGLAAFMLLGPEALKLSVALLIVGFAAWLLLARPRPAASRPGHAAAEVGVGVAAGALTAALAMPGPPVVLYLAAVGAGKEASRATLLTLCCLAYAGAMALQVTAVGLPPAIWHALVPLTPLAVAGVYAGHYCARHLSEARFRFAMLLLLLAAGAYMLLRAAIA